MKVDKYTMYVLTVIACALVWNIVKDFQGTAHAQQLSPIPIHFEEQYTYKSLARNRTFRRAVERVVENNCSVDGDSISC